MNSATIRRTLGVMSVFMFAHAAQAQAIRDVDLAKPEKDSIRVGPGKYTLRLSHALIGPTYTIEYTTIYVDKHGSVSLASDVKTRTDSLKEAAECALDGANRAALRASKEMDLPAAIDRVKTLFAVAKPADCSEAVMAAARHVLAPGTFMLDSKAIFSIQPGEAVVASVMRVNGKDSIVVASVVFRSNLDSPKPFVSYGLIYPWAQPMARFRLEAPNAAGQRAINDDASDPVGPALLLSLNLPTPIPWLRPSVFLPTAFKDGVLEGWGVGLSVGYNDWAFVHIGGVVGPQRRLKVAYRDSTATVKDELTEEQLTQVGYAFRPAVGLTVHWTANPFGKKPPA